MSNFLVQLQCIFEPDVLLEADIFVKKHTHTSVEITKKHI